MSNEMYYLLDNAFYQAQGIDSEAFEYLIELLYANRKLSPRDAEINRSAIIEILYPRNRWVLETPKN